MHTIGRVLWIGACTFIGSLFGGDDPAAAWWLAALGFVFGCATSLHGLLIVAWMIGGGVLAVAIGQNVIGSHADYWPFWFFGGVMIARGLVPAWPSARVTYLVARWRAKRSATARTQSKQQERV